MNYKPMFGTVSHSGGTWTMHYWAEGNTTSISKQGYDASVFKNCKDIPVIRFDKADLENVLYTLKGDFTMIEGYHHCIGAKLMPYEKSISLASHLRNMAKVNIPIEIWQ